MKHPQFPFGKGIWIWRIANCEGGDIDKIIKRLKDNDFKYALVKSGDGEVAWSQFNTSLISKFHDAGLKIYSWTYNYGLNPLREADIALWSLDMGADGHVFDAEGEYERLANPANTAKIMLLKVREKKPNAFLAHAPFPIVDYHTKFPYVEFGRYCDAVMPQMYWGTMQRTPENIISWTYQQWVKWEKIWKENGNGDSVKPLIPIGQSYDNPNTNFTLNPKDIKTFIDGVKGYKSVNFWSYQHILREDCWSAIRDSKMEASATPDLSHVNEDIDKPVENGSPAVVVPVVETPVVTENTPASEPVTTPTTPQEVNTPVENPSVPVDSVPSGEAIVPVDVQEALPDDNKQELKLPSKITVPIDIRTTIELVPNDNFENGIEVKIRYHKTHLDMFLALISYILRIFKKKEEVNK